MAKVTIEIDTNEKAVAVQVDGKAVENIHEIYVSGGDYFSMSLCQVEDAGDLRKVTRLYATSSKDGQKHLQDATGTVSTVHPGFVEVPDVDVSGLSNLISNYLRR